jgi:hypothetical protein
MAESNALRVGREKHCAAVPNEFAGDAEEFRLCFLAVSAT